MKYLSVCSGIEAATVAWHPLGWQPIGFSEIEAFPSAVLAHHYPDVRNYGDMTRYKEWDIERGSVDLLVGGTPCQSFSVAGLRRGLEDPRGNLALVYCGLLDHLRAQWCVWENVPGVLSSNGGRDFGSFLGALAELGYGFAYRVLDAQYFGVAQRRRRVFVVGYLGDWRPAAAVLFEPESLRRDPAPSREARQETAGATSTGVDRSSREQPYAIANCLTQRMHKGINTTLDEGQTPIIEAIPFDTTQVTSPLNYSNPQPGDACHPLAATAHIPAIAHSMAVRRLTPTECERLQGFPDGYTNIPWRKAIDSPDGPRYKALGNSMAVPVMRWIGERIQLMMPKLAG
jgi:DNA (cytosine-5)-methyltransferase 1